MELCIDHDLIENVIDSFNLGKESCYFTYDLNSDKCFYFCPSISNILGHDHRKYMNKGFLYFKSIIHPADFMIFIDQLLTLVKSADNLDETMFSGDLSGVAIRIRHKDGTWLTSRIHMIYLKGMPPAVERVLLGFIEKDPGVSQYPSSEIVRVTEREKEVFRLISTGYSAKMIADRLSISVNTVITHRKNLIQKLGVKNSAELIKRGLELNMVNVPPVFS
jgi:DNA-binding CsgD family transcriptional regulator